MTGAPAAVGQAELDCICIQNVILLTRGIKGEYGALARRGRDSRLTVAGYVAEIVAWSASAVCNIPWQ